MRTSFSTWLGLNVSTRRAAIVISVPVCGLRPTRALAAEDEVAEPRDLDLLAAPDVAVTRDLVSTADFRGVPLTRAGDADLFVLRLDAAAGTCDPASLATGHGSVERKRQNAGADSSGCEE